MSAEADFLALLTGHAGLESLVGDRIALSAVPQGETRPLVVFTAARSMTHGLNNSLHGTEVTFDVQCWADSADAAEDVADQVQAAINTDAAYLVQARSPAFDDETELDAVVLTVNCWIT